MNPFRASPNFINRLRNLFRPRSGPLPGKSGDVWKDRIEKPVFWPERYMDAPNTWGVHSVPYDKAYVVERFGRYVKTLRGGTHFLIPLIHRIAFVHSFQVQSLPISPLTAITGDGRKISLNSKLHYRIFQPKLASYASKNPLNFVVLRAVFIMRNEILKTNLDKLDRQMFDITAKARDILNKECYDLGVACVDIETKVIHKQDDPKVTELMMEQNLKGVMQSFDSKGDAMNMDEEPGVRSIQKLVKTLESPEFAEKPEARESKKLAEEATESLTKMLIEAVEKEYGVSSSSADSKEKMLIEAVEKEYGVSLSSADSKEKGEGVKTLNIAGVRARYSVGVVKEEAVKKY